MAIHAMITHRTGSPVPQDLWLALFNTALQMFREEENYASMDSAVAGAWVRTSRQQFEFDSVCGMKFESEIQIDGPPTRLTFIVSHAALAGHVDIAELLCTSVIVHPARNDAERERHRF